MININILTLYFFGNRNFKGMLIDKRLLKTQ